MVCVCGVVSECSVLSSPPPDSCKQWLVVVLSSGHCHCTGFASSLQRVRPSRRLASTSTPLPARPPSEQLQPHQHFHPLIATAHHTTSPASVHRPAFLLFLCHQPFPIPRPNTTSSSPPRCSSLPVAIHSRHLNSTRVTTHPPCQKAYNKTRSYSTMTRKRRARSASRSSTSPTRASSLVLVATRLVPRAAHCDPVRRH
jgi:hypothetical protein